MSSSRTSSQKNSGSDSDVTFVRSGKDFFHRLESVIDEAEHFIHFQTYIFEDDQTGRAVKDALIRAADRGVDIWLLLDAYGSKNLPKEVIEEMKSSGISFRYYRPLYSRGSFRLGRRLHHKIVVADGATSLVGGINIGDRYNQIGNTPPWLDFAVLSYGPVSVELLLICLRRWRRKAVTEVPAKLKKIYRSAYTPGEHLCRTYVRENDALMNKHHITTSYRKAFRDAKKEIVIADGYFIPGYRFRSVLKAASRRGVKVKIISGSKSDVALTMNARRFLYAWMLRHHFEIYEYTKAPVHGKVAVIDGHWTTVGSYDINNLSAYSNIEVNVEVHNDAFGEKVHGVLTKIIKEDCKQITQKNFIKKISLITQFKLWASFRITRMLFRFSSLLFAKTDD